MIYYEGVYTPPCAKSSKLDGQADGSWTPPRLESSVEEAEAFLRTASPDLLPWELASTIRRAIEKRRTSANPDSNVNFLAADAHGLARFMSDYRYPITAAPEIALLEAVDARSYPAIIAQALLR